MSTELRVLKSVLPCTSHLKIPALTVSQSLPKLDGFLGTMGSLKVAILGLDIKSTIY